MARRSVRDARPHRAISPSVRRQPAHVSPTRRHTLRHGLATWSAASRQVRHRRPAGDAAPHSGQVIPVRSRRRCPHARSLPQECQHSECRGCNERAHHPCVQVPPGAYGPQSLWFRGFSDPHDLQASGGGCVIRGARRDAYASVARPVFVTVGVPVGGLGAARPRAWPWCRSQRFPCEISPDLGQAVTGTGGLVDLKTCGGVHAYPVTSGRREAKSVKWQRLWRCR